MDPVLYLDIADILIINKIKNSVIYKMKKLNVYLLKCLFTDSSGSSPRETRKGCNKTYNRKI